MSGHRREQLESTLHSVLQVALRDLNDPRMEGLVTITGVEVTPDMKSALVRVSVLPAKHESKVLAALQHAHVHLRRMAGVEIKTVRIPDLHFQIDQGLKRQAGVIEALAKVAAEREARGEKVDGVDAGVTDENNDGQAPTGEPSPPQEPRG